MAGRYVCTCRKPRSCSTNAVRIKKPCDGFASFITFRSHKEGGNKKISDSNYQELIQTVIKTKNIDLIDIELFTGDSVVKELVALADENGIFVVMSNHDFHKTPNKEEMIDRLRKMQELGAHIPKMAVMPNSIEDVITLLDATNTMKTKYADRPIITMSMGEDGLISRLAGEVFGSACTFAAGKEKSAPGQIPVSELRTVLEIIKKIQGDSTMTNFQKNLEKIDGKTKLVGLLATPIGHSLSPRMHNLGYTLKGLNYSYLAFEVGNETLEKAVEGMRALDVAGFNVSMPNKMEVIKYLDELDASAKFTGAVNTVVHKDGRLIGYNSDGKGYVKNLEVHGIDLYQKKSH